MHTLRGLARIVAAALTWAAVPAGGAAAEEWPLRPVTMVIAFGAGSGIDVLGRILAPAMAERLGQPIVVENIGGAGGTIGTARVARSSPDGYTFVLGNVGTHAVNQSLYSHPLYDAAHDFAPVALIADTPQVLIARADLPTDGLQGFVDYVKANQAKMQYGSPGAGSAAHLACAMLNAAIGINVTHVPYRGGGPAMQDLISGRIDYQCPLIALALPQIAGGKVRAIAALTARRTTILPQLATAQEQGLAGFGISTWNALFLPKDTPQTIVRKLHDAAVAALDLPDIQGRLRQVGAEPALRGHRSPEFLDEFVGHEIDKWGIAIRAAGMSPQ